MIVGLERKRLGVNGYAQTVTMGGEGELITSVDRRHPPLTPYYCASKTRATPMEYQMFQNKNQFFGGKCKKMGRYIKKKLGAEK